MLPKKIINYIPDPLIENMDDAGQALIDYLDSFISDTKNSILKLWYMKYPEITEEVTLNYWGEYLSAEILPSDTIRQKRIKIANAIKNHKFRSTWLNDVKIKIDLIAGGDSQRVTNFYGDDWILTGDGTTPAGAYWGTMGIDGIDNNLGLGLIGTGDEIEIPGNIYIDVDNNSLTAGQLDEIEITINDSLPAYMRIFLGYISAGNFILYRILE